MNLNAPANFGLIYQYCIIRVSWLLKSQTCSCLITMVPNQSSALPQPQFCSHSNISLIWRLQDSCSSVRYWHKGTRVVQHFIHLQKKLKQWYNLLFLPVNLCNIAGVGVCANASFWRYAIQKAIFHLSSYC